MSHPGITEQESAAANIQVQEDTTVVTEVLVEEVSIDGMCGVY